LGEVIAPVAGPRRRSRSPDDVAEKEMTEKGPLSPDGPGPPLAWRIDQVCNRFEVAWRTGTPRIEDFLEGWGEPQRGALLRELVLIDLDYRRARGEKCLAADYQERFPALDLTTADNEDPGASARPSGELAAEAATMANLPRRAEAPAADGLAVRFPQRLGDYELLEEIARGGMGVVFKARQQSVQRVVALKMILAAPLASPAEEQRFRAEAEAVAALDHPHIVPLFEAGECDGHPYYTMRLMEGGSLAGQLTRLVPNPCAAAALMEVVARAVHYAHQRGILHRDLKPANILLDANGVPHVTDFGLARRLDGSTGLTQPGAIVGTPGYMAPEQAGGSGQRLTTAADVYALGAILYELLTGQPPFQAATPLETVLQVIADEPAPVRRLRPAVPKDLATVCHKCLEKHPARRYASAEALAEDLRRFGSGEPVAARPVGLAGRVARWARRRPAVAGLLLLVATVVAAGLEGILWSYGEARQAAKTARQEAENARQERERADEKAAEAQAKEKEALWQAYLAQIGRADAQLQAGDHAGALQVLDRVDPEQRGWEYRCLQRRAEGTPLTLRGHTNGVRSVAYSPDGTRLASASLDRTVKVWDVTSGTEVATLRGHTGQVQSVAYSPDGTRLASAAEDTTVKIWDANSGAEVATLRGHAANVWSVCYSPDGTRLASASEDQTVKLWDVRRGAELATLRGHTSWVTSVAYSPDGTRLASASYDQTVKVWDAKSGAPIATLPRLAVPLSSSVAYSPDGARLASAAGSEVKLWDAASGAERATLRGHTNVVYAVCCSPDGTRLASASWDHTVKIWDAKSGDELATLRGHTGQVLSVAYSPDGCRLATASWDQTVKVWDVARGTEPPTLRGHTSLVLKVAYSPDGTRLASASMDRTVKVWDCRSGAELATLRGHTAPVYSVAFSPDGTRLASGSVGEVKLWDAHSGTEVGTLRGHSSLVTAVAYSPDGTRLASASGDIYQPLGRPGEVKVWDARSGAELATLRGHSGPVNALAYSLDGTRLASASHDKTVKLWDAGSGAELATLRGHADRVSSVAYSPDGTRLASASIDKTVKVWDVRKGAVIATLRGHTSHVYSVAYSRDGMRLASAAQDNSVKLWDAKSGAELTTLRGHAAFVYSVVYSPDGTGLASAAQDNTVKLWDARRGAVVASLRGHGSAVTSVAYSPDSSRLVSKDADGKTLVWDTATGKLVPDEPPQQLHPGNVSPDGRFLAVPEGDTVRLCLRRPPHDFWAEDRAQHRVQAPRWHAEQAAAADKCGDAFAAAFHRRQLAAGDNLRLLAWAHLAAGDKAACVRTIDTLRQRHRLLAGLAPAGPVFAVLAAGPAPALCTAAAAAPLERERRRLAAQLVRAATLFSDSGVPAEELVALARSCVEAEPESWQARELLGAALYRQGNAAQAARELDEAVRRQGGGSPWAQLFLALAHRRLGHADTMARWLRPAANTLGWEDRVIQRQLLAEKEAP
jgi:WD40 repeat protein